MSSVRLKGAMTGSPRRKFARKLPAKHIRIEDNQQLNGCFRENKAAPLARSSLTAIVIYNKEPAALLK